MHWLNSRLNVLNWVKKENVKGKFQSCLSSKDTIVRFVFFLVKFFQTIFKYYSFILLLFYLKKKNCF